MIAGGGNKLPFGNIPRLLLAWVTTEAVRTQSRELILGSSLSEFMGKLGMDSVGGARTRLRNQMRRLFNAHVQLVYEDKLGEASVSSSVTSRTEFWWDPKQPDVPMLWDSKIELGWDFFNEIIRRPVPLDMNTLAALKRCSLGLDLYLWLAYRTFALKRPLQALLAAVVPPVRSGPGQSQRQASRQILPPPHPARVEENQAGLAGVELLDGSGSPDPAPLDPQDRADQSGPARSLVSPFSAARSAPDGVRESRVSLRGSPHHRKPLLELPAASYATAAVRFIHKCRCFWGVFQYQTIPP